MSLRILSLFLIVLISTTATASGSREIAIADCLNQQCTETKLAGLDKETYYLGSTDTWHLFAKVLTSHSENDDGSAAMPYDNVYGYKVPIEDATVSNPYTLTAEDREAIAVIRSCPQIETVDEKKKSIKLSKVTNSCLIK